MAVAQVDETTCQLLGRPLSGDTCSAARHSTRDDTLRDVNGRLSTRNKLRGKPDSSLG